MPEEEGYCEGDQEPCIGGNCKFWKSANGHGPEGYCILDLFIDVCDPEKK